MSTALPSCAHQKALNLSHNRIYIFTISLRRPLGTFEGRYTERSFYLYSRYMNIPSGRKNSADHTHTSSSYVEGFARSYQRVAQFEAVDTRARRSSAAATDISQGQQAGESIHERIRRSSHGQTEPAYNDEESGFGANVTESTALLAAVHGSIEKETKSSAAQTIFNITNLLIGIGLLSLPLGIRAAGWFLGTLLLIVGAGVTSYTSVLLARSLETRPDAYAYSDIATMAYGRVMTWITALIFMLELLAAGTALTILFSDNFNAVLPQISSTVFKIICFCVMLPGTLLPLRILSFTSIVGIFSTITLILVVFADGLWKAESPGSLRDPMATDVFPERWSTVPIAFGLLMASFGGHGIFPQVYTDMQDRKQFTRCVVYAYLFSTIICIFVGTIGYLMFGDEVQSEITLNLLSTPGFPKALNKVAVIMTGITSLTKAPLTTKAIAANVDVFFGLKTMKEERRNGSKRFSGYLLVRLSVNLVILLVAVFFPSFDRVMSVLGSAFVSLISIMLPALFYIRVMDRTKERLITPLEKFGLWSMIIISGLTGLACTLWAFIPSEL